MLNLTTRNIKLHAQVLGMTCEVVPTGHPRYHRVFLLRPDGCTIARLTFLDDCYDHAKFYKPDYLRDFDESDRCEARFRVYVATGRVLTDGELTDLIVKSTLEAKLDLAAKIEARKLLPQKSRRRLTGRNPRHLFKEKIREMAR